MNNFWIISIILLLVIFYCIKNKYIYKKSNKINITIFASGIGNRINKRYFEKSRELINKLDVYKNKINLVYGGGNKGLMGLVSNFKGNIISSNINKFVDSTLPDEYVFDNLRDRQKKLIDLADMFIILPGGYGTFYELMEILSLNNLGVSNKPIVIYNIENFFDEFINFLDNLWKKGFLSKKINELNVHILNNPDNVINIIKQLKLLK
jgi:uncharacterized protein (TIGR00730 family)